ncbi:unnamed protein product [Linum tenue]|uniref:Bifunctional inhibitor/plant lipid transfer protein/seed storage helical domain-containing protein n=1 Tax=Linum tenue TaxID=586396 RepID=A0AAV0GQG0_9ROSI|nr:unnamed protein product [Linum tenue]
MGVEALVCLAALVAGATLFLSQGATAQSSSSCTNTLVSLSPCLDYITGNSTTPTRSCCTQLGNVAGSQPECLCQVIGGGGGGNSLGININQTQALALPAACKVQTPPASSCNNGKRSLLSPLCIQILINGVLSFELTVSLFECEMKPAGSPSGAPDTPPGTRGGGSGTTPSSSDGNTATMTSTLLFVGLLLACYSAIFPTTVAV